MKRILNLILTLLLFYIVYALTVSTLPFAKRVKVSEKSKKRLQKLNFLGGAQNGGDRALLVETPHDAFNIRMEMIRAAGRKIDVVYHTVHKGGSSDAFFGALLEAADRGVAVRILLDGKVGAADSGVDRMMQALDRHQNIEFKQYNTARMLSPWNWHALMHDKFLVVDERYMLSGGRNIGDKYFAPGGYKGKITNDRDVFVERTDFDTSDSVLVQSSLYIETLWQSRYVNTPRASTRLDTCGELLRMALSAKEFQAANPHLYQHSLSVYCAAAIACRKITLINNPIHVSKKEPWVGHQLCRLMAEAQKNVTVQTPYATRNSSLLAAMKTGSEHVDFTMVTNSLASSPNYPAFSNYYVNRHHFIKTGVSIFEYQSNDSIHGKSLVIDDRLGIVGSFNMDERSFYIDTETMLVVDSEEFAASLNKAIENYRSQSLCVCGAECEHETPVAAQPVPKGKRLLMQLTSVLSRALQFLI